MASTLVAAAACAAYLMGAEPVLPNAYFAQQPPAEICIKAGAPACRGVTARLVDGRIAVVAIDDFGVLVHEMCHVIQHSQGRHPAEPECYAIQARASECFAGTGIPAEFYLKD